MIDVEHEHQFPEEETPNGVRILLPCLLCGLSAFDALAALKKELAAKDDTISVLVKNREPEFQYLLKLAIKKNVDDIIAENFITAGFCPRCLKPVDR